jgi:hypothetical protein
MPNTRNLAQRPAKPALGRGRIQKAARRAALGRQLLSTADVCELAFVRKRLLHGRRLEPRDYRLARAALRLIADPIGRDGGRGRPLLWRRRDTEQNMDTGER